MADFLVTLMGIFDVIAGILILISFNFNSLSIIFGIIMIIKGLISFNFTN